MCRELLHAVRGVLPGWWDSTAQKGRRTRRGCSSEGYDEEAVDSSRWNAERRGLGPLFGRL